jgi:hypothetical protein
MLADRIDSVSEGQDLELQDTQRDAAVQAAEEPPPYHAVETALRWNDSKTTIWRLSATLWCAFVMGANDAAYGAIITYVSIKF